VRGEHNDRAVWHLVDLLDEDRALGLEVADDVQLWTIGGGR